MFTASAPASRALVIAMTRDAHPHLSPAQIAAQADAVDALLPQTQCRRCGYDGCRPYAEAIVRGTADINQCPPGGDDGVRALAALLRVAPKPLDPARGPALHEQQVALIDEAQCIGCMLCIQVCPVDAILGAAKLMHTVIEQECTGCELCIAPCPVDCIRMLPPQRRTDDAEARRERADHARRRHQFRLRRLAQQEAEDAARLREKREVVAAAGGNDNDAAPRRDQAIVAAVERARAKREARRASDPSKNSR